MMDKKRVALVLVVLLVAASGALFWWRGRSTHPANKLSVVASFYPLYDFAQQIGGDKVSVTNVTPAGAEPHDYEPSPQALVQAQQAAVFIYNGGTLEPWAGKFVSDFHHVAVRASDGIALKTTDGVTDPHFWLDPLLARQIVANIRDGLTRADPANAAYFRTRAAAYDAQLTQLDQAFRAGLADCQTRTIVTSHAAFGYLAARYNLQVYAIAGVTPDEEPSAAALAHLTDVVRAQHIKYVFFESLVSPRLAATIAQETGAKTAVFDPLEGLSDEAQKQGKNYLSVQRDNLAALRAALACH